MKYQICSKNTVISLLGTYDQETKENDTLN